MWKITCDLLIKFVKLKTMTNEIAEEISLRDVYLILKKNIRLIFAVTLSAAILAVAASLILPKNFSSQVIMNLSVNTERSEFKAAPNAVGLSQGFIQLINNESLAGLLQEERLEGILKAKFDDKKSLLTLSAYGTTAEQALARAQKVQAVAVDYFTNQISGTVRTNLDSNLAQTKIDIASTGDNLKRLEPLLNSTKAIINSTTDAAALESRGIDPQLARATNPALVNLALQISQSRIGLANLEAREASLTSVLKNEKTFQSLLGQGFQVQVLAAPALALSAESPSPLMITTLAAVAGLLLGLVGAFVLEALRPESPALITSSQSKRFNNTVPQGNPGD